MIAAALGQAGGTFVSPDVDFHAFAPEIVLVGAICLVLFADLVTPRGRSNASLPSLAGIGLLASIIPVLTLAADGADRSMFGGAYVVDNFALVLKVLFLLSGYIVVLLSTNYIAEGDYAEGEYYFLLLSSILGMTVMASARDLISIFVALELLSIPAYMLAGWRRQDLKGNEAMAKYYLMGVFASAVMLYGMSLVYGLSGSTVLAQIGPALSGGESPPIVTLGIVFVLVGFGFKVSAVPFHTWAPDTYEGAPTPITAFLAVLSKTAGFVALIQLILIAFEGRDDVVGPMMWVLSVATMTVGNLIALRQTNMVRLLAYSGIAQAGFMLAPFAVADSNPELVTSSIVTYLLIYAAMNLGAFAVVLAVARKTRSARDHQLRWPVQLRARPGRAHDDLPLQPGGHPAPRRLAGQAAGVPGGDRGQHARRPTSSPSIMAVNSVIALFYYANVAREMWMNPVVDGDVTPDPRPGLADRGPGHLRRAHPGVRGVEPGDPLRRCRQLHAGRRARPLTRRPEGPVVSLAEEISRRIDRDGPLRFSEVIDLALYDPERGFYATAGRAGGHRGDFITSPEVGPLFGALVGRYLDRVWDDLGRPDRFTCVEAGAGPGTLARAVLAARPRCREVLEYVIGRDQRGAAGPAPCRGGAGRRAALGSLRRGHRRQRAARQPAIRPVRVHRRGLGRGAPRTRGCAPRPVRKPVLAPKDGAGTRFWGQERVGARVPVQARASAWVDACPRTARARAASSSSTTRRPPPSWRRDLGETGCAPTGAMGAAPIPSPRSASRTSPARWPSTSWWRRAGWSRSATG